MIHFGDRINGTVKVYYDGAPADIAMQDSELNGNVLTKDSSEQSFYENEEIEINI